MGPINAATNSSSTRNVLTGGPGAAAPVSAVQDVMRDASQFSDLSAPGNAAHILASGSDFLTAASGAVASLDHQIGVRSERLKSMQSGGGVSSDVLQHERTQIDLLTKLLDRLKLSMERVAKILSGDDDKSDATSHRSALGGAGAIRVIEPSPAVTAGSSSHTGGGSVPTQRASNEMTLHAALRAYNGATQP
jgi:hypothetical protein